MAFLTRAKRTQDAKTATRQAVLRREITANNATAKKAQSPLEIAKNAVLGLPKASVDVAAATGRGAQGLANDAFKTLIAAPAIRLAQLEATVIGGAVGGEKGERIKQRALQPIAAPSPFGGTVRIEGQKAFGEGGATQVTGQGLKTAAYLAPVGRVASAGSSLVKGNVGSAAVNGTLAGFMGGTLDGAGEALIQEAPTVADTIKRTATGAAFGAGGGLLLGGGGAFLSRLARNSKGPSITDTIVQIVRGGKKEVLPDEFAGMTLDQRLAATGERKLPVYGDTTPRPLPVAGQSKTEAVPFANDYRQTQPDIPVGTVPKQTVAASSPTGTKAPPGYRYEAAPEAPRAPVANVPRETAPIPVSKTKAAVAPVSTRLYHGTAEDFTTFDRTKAGTGVGSNAYDQGDQIYLTESPDAGKFFAQAAADIKTLRNGSFPDGKNKGQVLEFEIKPEAKILEIDDMPRGGRTEEVNAIINKARADGYDAIRFVDKGFDTVEGNATVGKIYDELGRPPKTTIVLNDDVVTRVQPETPRAPEMKASGLAKGVETQAVEKKLTDGFEGLSEYQTINIKDQAERATKIIANDYDQAKRIAMGTEEAPAGTKAFAVYTALEQKAIKDGDVSTLRDLATRSRLNAQSSESAQTLRLLAERDPASPVAAIAEISKAREKAAARRGIKDPQKVVNTEVKAAKAAIARAPKAPKETWNSFIDDLTC